MIKRILQANILKTSFHGKVLIMQGPRQVGKTTLALEIVKVCRTGANPPIK